MLLYQSQCFLQVYVTYDNEDGIIRPIPGFEKPIEHGIRCFTERESRSKGIMGIWRPHEHLIEKLHVKKIFGIRKIVRHLLFYRSPFLLPELL
ncbi:MAG: hypothetical protein CSYNP_04097 [Syntrophus sp. SKADARSKE-3]|nr:hypothetical protein [Syntrophus sp. SKADARSKE-3]